MGGWARGHGGGARLAPGAASAAVGVHNAIRAGGTTVLSSQSLASQALTVRALRAAGGQMTVVATIASLAEEPALPGLRVELLRAGRREIRTALLLPSWHEEGSAKLPVLLDPYGAP